MVLTAVLKFTSDVLVWYIFASFFRAYSGIPLSDAVMMIPALIYVVWMCAKGYTGADYDRQKERARKLCLLFLVLPFLSMLRAGDGKGSFLMLMRLIVPPLIVFFLLQILLFRILRQDPAIRNDRRYQISSLLMVLFLFALVAVFTRTRLLYGMTQLLILIWKGPVRAVFGAILWIFSYTIGLVLYAAVLLLIRLSGNGERPFQEEGGALVPQDPVVFAEDISRGAPAWLMTILMILGTAILIVFSIKLFRLLSDRTGAENPGSKPGEMRSRIDPVSGASRVRAAFLFSPAGRIRRSYRHFLKQIRKEEAKAVQEDGVRIPPNAASLDYLDAALCLFPEKKERIGELTKIYQRARYEDREDPVTKEDAARMETLEKEFVI